MIIFKTVRYKNFLSSGDEFTEISLDSAVSTLIVGKNGAGKSTITDAISFGLFGKAHRNINKVQLVNSINAKKCVVEVEFEANNVPFKVVRGIKPAVFEIYQDGKMINQTSTTRDYQKHLEVNILKMNHRSFHQVVVLESSSFVPFMQLPANARREIIEGLLDINIFSRMNVVVKERLARNKDAGNALTYQLELLKEKVDLQKKYIKELKRLDSSRKDANQAEIAKLDAEIEELNSEVDNLETGLVSNKSRLTEALSNAKRDRKTSQDFLQDFNHDVKSIVRESRFYEKNDVCSTCSQDIPTEVKDKQLGLLRVRAKELHEKMQAEQSELDRHNALIEKLEDEWEEIQAIESKINEKRQAIKLLQRTKASKEAKEDEDCENETKIRDAEASLQDLIDQGVSLTDDKLELSEERHYLVACAEMLKDSGIKTKIIREYLPAMNAIVNNYLQVLDFFVDFHLDEGFNETIRSRHRDTFSYGSFSEGEKMKIDLALLFAWRHVAKMKNSVATNLLILDETFDSSLDQDGVENLTQIMETLEDGTNTFVISHKGDILDGKFQDRIEFVKSGNFSVIN